jgi:hypothetical protein
MRSSAVKVYSQLRILRNTPEELLMLIKEMAREQYT